MTSRSSRGLLLYKRSTGGCLTVTVDGRKLSYTGPPTAESVWEFDGCTGFGDDVSGLPNFIRHVASGKYLQFINDGRDLALTDEPPATMFDCRVYAENFPTESLQLNPIEGRVNKENRFDAMTVSEADPVLLAALQASVHCSDYFIYVDGRGLASVASDGNDQHALVFIAQPEKIPDDESQLATCLWTVQEGEPEGYGVQARNVASGQFLHTDGTNLLLAPSAEEAVLGQDEGRGCGGRLGSLCYVRITDPENGAVFPPLDLVVI